MLLPPPHDDFFFFCFWRFFLSRFLSALLFSPKSSSIFLRMKALRRSPLSLTSSWPRPAESARNCWTLFSTSTAPLWSPERESRLAFCCRTSQLSPASSHHLRAALVSPAFSQSFESLSFPCFTEWWSSPASRMSLASCVSAYTMASLCSPSSSQALASPSRFLDLPKNSFAGLGCSTCRRRLPSMSLHSLTTLFVGPTSLL
mmetsp:Transcript_30985/g.61436  ORF Transcript_30985/g.61436 Transcript_30985/m.61436 type:complete len:202 (-) Transcript_30985:921-1526(-)